MNNNMLKLKKIITVLLILSVLITVIFVCIFFGTHFVIKQPMYNGLFV